MTSEEAYNILLDVVTNDLKHADYERVCELMDFYYMVNTGKGIKERLHKFSPREEQDMFEQRENLTITTLKEVSSSARKAFNKVPRTPPITKKITGNTDKDANAVAEIEERISKFYGSENNVGGLDYYIQNRFVDLLSFNDPNAWVIIEFDSFDSNTTKPFPRPFEASAREAINFSIKNNIVEWLIVELKIKFEETDGDKKIKKEGSKFTIYADNDAWVFQQISTKKGVMSDQETIFIEGKGTFTTTNFPINAEKVLAFRVGYRYDIETNGRTFVNPLDEASDVFLDLIQQCSEFSLAKRLHLFPQKVVRQRFDCPGERGQKCDKGSLTDGTKCGKCKGSGRLVHTSGQDLVEVDLPDTKDDLIPLSEFIQYISSVPIDLIKFQKELIDDGEIRVHKTVFNSTALLRTSSVGGAGTSDINIAKTATEQNDNMESVNDTLNPFAEKLASVWTTIAEDIAILTDNKDKVSIIYRPASKFKLKTRQDLYLERLTVKNSGVPAFVIDAIDDELAQDIYADDPEGLLKYKVKKQHYPFIGKNQDEIAQLLGSTAVMKKTKVLYSYFDEIFQELEREYKKMSKDFYLESADVRQEQIDLKVEEIVTQLSDDSNTAFNFKLAAITGNQTQEPPIDNTVAA